MKRSFYPNRDEERFVDATILGYVELESGRVRSVHLTSQDSVYGKEKFDAVVRLVE